MHDFEEEQEEKLDPKSRHRREFYSRRSPEDLALLAHQVIDLLKKELGNDV